MCAVLRQDRIVGLIIDPGVLMSIRRNRVGLMGVGGKDNAMSINYAELAVGLLTVYMLADMIVG